MMHHVMGQAMTEDDVDDLLREADIDGDGQLNYEGMIELLKVRYQYYTLPFFHLNDSHQ